MGGDLLPEPVPSEQLVEPKQPFVAAFISHPLSNGNILYRSRLTGRRYKLVPHREHYLLYIESDGLTDYLLLDDKERTKEECFLLMEADNIL